MSNIPHYDMITWELIFSCGSRGCPGQRQIWSKLKWIGLQKAQAVCLPHCFAPDFFTGIEAADEAFLGALVLLEAGALGESSTVSTLVFFLGVIGSDTLHDGFLSTFMGDFLGEAILDKLFLSFLHFIIEEPSFLGFGSTPSGPLDDIGALIGERGGVGSSAEPHER